MYKDWRPLAESGRRLGSHRRLAERLGANAAAVGDGCIDMSEVRRPYVKRDDVYLTADETLRPAYKMLDVFRLKECGRGA